MLRPLFIDASGHLEDGAKRYAAALCLGIKKLPYVIYPTPLIFKDDLILRDLASLSLHFFEYAGKLEILTETYLYTQEYIALALNKSQSFIANKLRLLRFEEDERDEIVRAGLTERHCRTLLRLPQTDLRRRALAKVIAGGLNVMATDEFVSSMLGCRPERQIEVFLSELKGLVQKFSRSLDIDAEDVSSDRSNVSVRLTARERFT